MNFTNKITRLFHNPFLSFGRECSILAVTKNNNEIMAQDAHMVSTFMF